MLNIRRYFQILEEAKHIIESLGYFPDRGSLEYRDALVIYGTAIRQLTMAGVAYDIENGMVTMASDGEIYTAPEEAVFGTTAGKTIYQHTDYMHSTPGGKQRMKTAAGTEQSMYEPDENSEEYLPEPEEDDGIEEYDEEVGNDEELRPGQAAKQEETVDLREDEAAEPADKTPDTAMPGTEEQPADNGNDNPGGGPGDMEEDENKESESLEEEEDLPEDYGYDKTLILGNKQDKEETEEKTPDPAEGEARADDIEGDGTEAYKQPEDEFVPEPKEPAEEDENGFVAAEPVIKGMGEEEEAQNNDKPEENKDGGERLGEKDMMAMETVYEAPPKVALPDHMYKGDFTFCYMTSEILDQEGNRLRFQVIMAPLNPGADIPRAIACIIYGGKSTSVVSGKDTSRITTKIGGYPVTIEGWYNEEGRYEATLMIPEHYVEEGVRIQNKARYFGDKGHIALEDTEEDLTIHIIPVTFSNNEQGTAEFIYLISHGMNEAVGDTSMNKRPHVDFEGKTYEIVCRWTKEDVLYSSAKEV